MYCCKVSYYHYLLYWRHIGKTVKSKLFVPVHKPENYEVNTD